MKGRYEYIVEARVSDGVEDGKTLNFMDGTYSRASFKETDAVFLTLR
jgi:hypothetical protein